MVNSIAQLESATRCYTEVYENRVGMLCCPLLMWTVFDFVVAMLTMFARR